MNEAIGATELVSDIQKEALKSVIAFQQTLLEKQISNLEEQKNTLGEINKQREYENKLIEAKLKLESVQKDKKRIWREGVGWVYEADQTAIQQAQEELDALDTEKKQAALQEEITQLQADKQRLENISKEEEFEQQKDMYDAWIKKYNTYNEKYSGTYANILSAVQDKTSPLVQFTSSINAELTKFYTSWEADKKKRISTLQTSYEALVAAEKDYKEKSAAAKASPTDRGKQTAASAALEGYNKALLAYQEEYNYNQSKGYISNKDFQESIDSNKMFSEASLAAATKEVEVDTRKTWLVPDPKGGKDYTVVSDEQERITNADELASITKSFDKENAVVWYPGAAGDSGVVGGKIPDLDVGRSNINTWVGLHPEALILYDDGKKWARVTSGKIYRASELSAPDQDIDVVDGPGFASGTLAAPGGLARVNELGTEAIITPQGTITALPSRTGIVPSDITSNLWSLGELAPSILRSLENISYNDTFKANSNSGITDESVNINTITMNVSADGDFDIDAFVRTLRAQAALIKNNK